MVSDRPSAPFTCTHTPELPELLGEFACSLVLSTYQAGKVILLSSDGERLVQLPRTFDTPMGLAVDQGRLAVATRHEIVLLANEPRLAASYPKQPGIYDSLFVPRSVHVCGALDVHDLAWTPNGLVGVNTLFSCLFTIDERWSFRPLWKPAFVSALAPEDRCHLNGVAIVEGRPRFVTALGATDTREGWREGKERAGVLLDVASGEVVLAGLAMPHSPRLFEGRLYVLLSATGELVAVEPDCGRYEVVRRIDGFVRGLACAGDHLFIASSRIRKNHTFGDLGTALDRKAFCGITVLHRQTGAFEGEIRFVRSCEEIYDVQVLPGLRRPGILGVSDSTYRRALATPDQTFWALDPEAARSGGPTAERQGVESS